LTFYYCHYYTEPSLAFARQSNKGDSIMAETMTALATRQSIMEAWKQAIKNTLSNVIQVIPKPDEGDGSDWWVGIHTHNSNGLWDTTSVDKQNAEDAAEGCRKDLFEMIEQEYLKLTGGS
jgi:hypothetical protein